MLMTVSKRSYYNPLGLDSKNQTSREDSNLSVLYINDLLLFELETGIELLNHIKLFALIMKIRIIKLFEWFNERISDCLVVNQCGYLQFITLIQISCTLLRKVFFLRIIEDYYFVQ